MSRLFFSTTFLKSQVTAAVATAVDFIILVILVELAQVWYVLAAAIAAFCGALSSFFLGRQWTFLSKDDKWHHQAQRYTLVALGSMGLNTFGIYLFTDGLGLHYMTSKIVISIIVSLGFNYPLQKYFVFKK